MRKTLTLTLILATGLLAGLAHASSGGALRATLAVLTADAGKSPAKVVAALERRGFQRVCERFDFATTSPGLPDLKVCWSAGRWTATLRYPHLYDQPPFSTLARRISKKYGAPTRAPRPYLASPKVDVWHARRGRARISLVRIARSDVLEIKISGSTR